MVGITAYGAYVPMLRLPLAAIGGGTPKPGGPEKAVANWDEDAVTHGRRGGDRLPARHRPRRPSTPCSSRRRRIPSRRSRARRSSPRRSTCGATSTPATSATTLARRHERAAHRPSTRSRRAPRGACWSWPATPAWRRRAPALEANLGDGAAAFLVGADDVAASVDAVHSISDEIVDVWRTEGDPFVHAWEDRFVVDHGYRAGRARGGAGPAREGGARARRTSRRCVLYGPDARAHATAVRELRLRREGAGAGPALRQGRQRGRGAGAAAARRRRSSSAKAGQRLARRRLRRRRRRAGAVRPRRTSSGWKGVAASPGTSLVAPSWEATISTCASASSWPPSTTAAPAPASRRPSTSATATPTSACSARSAAGAARRSSRASASASTATRGTSSSRSASRTASAR